MASLRIGFLYCLLGLSSIVYANPAVDRLLAADEEPLGVVFEIIEGQRDALGWALPLVKQHTERLRERFPDLHVAVVTHGGEQFGLLSSAANELDSIHDEARSFQGSGIDLHVCGVHASWYGHTSEDFPSYVDVAASAPAQINDYVNLGYELIRLDR